MAAQDLEYVAFERDLDPSHRPPAPEKGGPLLERIKTPTWKVRSSDLPLLGNPSELGTTWAIRFDGRPERAMDTFAFKTRGNATVKYVAVVVPKGTKPKAWLIYFRHTAQMKDFNNDLLELGAGDYIDGRMQVSKQLAISGKDVGAILPIAYGTCGEFAGNQPFVTRCLEEIEMSLFGAILKPPLLAASNSDGLFQLNGFLKGCPALCHRLKGIYDFDGTHHVKSGGISLMVPGAKTFRYEGRLSPTQGAIPAGQTDVAFLSARMGRNPSMVPLALSRWRAHNRFGEVRPGEKATDPRARGDALDEAHSLHDWNWLHNYIPTCMLHHGLVSTPGI